MLTNQKCAGHVAERIALVSCSSLSNLNKVAALFQGMRILPRFTQFDDPLGRCTLFHYILLELPGEDMIACTLRQSL